MSAAMFNSTLTDRTLRPALSVLDLEMDAFGRCFKAVKNHTRAAENTTDDLHFITIWDVGKVIAWTVVDVWRFGWAFVHCYGPMVFYFAMMAILLYVLYKSYLSPVVIIKELSDVGFDHISGPNRKAEISRAQRARRLGSELPPPYPNGWFALVESRALGVGDVRAVDALGVNLCVYRAEDGAARCVDAYCPHLGANMAAGGVVRGACVQCPFHEWRFDGETGACVSVPGLEKPPKGVGVRAWTTVECAGAVWVWHDAGGAPPAWDLPAPSQLAGAGWGYRGLNRYVVSCHIQDIPENGADVAHLNSVHSPSLLTQLGEKYPTLLAFIGRHVWSAEWTRGKGHEAHMRLRHEYRAGKASLCRVDIDATQVGPGAVYLRAHTAAGPLLVAQSVTPLSPRAQLVTHRVFSPWWNAPIGAAFVYAESAMFERDLTIWNNKRFVHNPVYVRADKSIRAFRAWYSQFYSEASLSFQQAMRRHTDPLDW